MSTILYRRLSSRIYETGVGLSDWACDELIRNMLTQSRPYSACEYFTMLYCVKRKKRMWRSLKLPSGTRSTRFGRVVMRNMDKMLFAYATKWKRAAFMLYGSPGRQFVTQRLANQANDTDTADILSVRKRHLLEAIWVLSQRLPNEFLRVLITDFVGSVNFDTLGFVIIPKITN